MDDLRTRAQLVAFDGAGSVGTVVTRDEVAAAAAGPAFPATLQLELDRADSHASLAVDWDRDTLEQLLASTDDDEIGLWFREPELAQAFDDVEGHGLRQRAAAIAVAATAAGATATPALARMVPGNEGGGGGTPAAAAVAQPAAGAERGLQQDEQVGAATGTHGFSVDPAAARRGAVVQPAGAERALLQDEQLGATQGGGGGSPAVTTTSGGSTLSTGELAAAVAGGALLISAAGFGAARRRTPPAQPA
jgi:hypothetical protein